MRNYKRVRSDLPGVAQCGDVPEVRDNMLANARRAAVDNVARKLGLKAHAERIEKMDPVAQKLYLCRGAIALHGGRRKVSLPVFSWDKAKHEAE